jgi:hypothetical protein
MRAVVSGDANNAYTSIGYGDVKYKLAQCQLLQELEHLSIN